MKSDLEGETLIVEDWMMRAARRIFTHAIAWVDDKKTWSDEYVGQIIAEEQAKAMAGVFVPGKGRRIPPPPGGYGF